MPLSRIDKEDEDCSFFHRLHNICGRRIHQHHVGVSDEVVAIVDKGDALE